MDNFSAKIRNYFSRPNSARQRASEPPSYSQTLDRDDTRRVRAETSPNGRRRASHAAGEEDAAADDRRLQHRQFQPRRYSTPASGDEVDSMAVIVGRLLMADGDHPAFVDVDGTPPALSSSQTAANASFKFPPNEAARIKFVPYNPYFPAVEKQLTNGTTLSIGRYQRRQPEDDPKNEGIYYRSTVVSRKHAQLSFIDGEVSVLCHSPVGSSYSTVLYQGQQVTWRDISEFDTSFTRWQRIKTLQDNAWRYSANRR
jgi:hypothetical protein